MQTSESPLDQTWTIATRDRHCLARCGRLNRTAEGAVRAADSDALWWLSSPSPGPLPFGDAECLEKAMQRLTVRNLPSSFTPKRD